MTGVRLRGVQNVPDGDYELVNFTHRIEWVLRGDANVVYEFEQDAADEILVRCDFCGEWVNHAAPDPGSQGWRCYGGVGPCEEEGGEGGGA